MPMPLKDETGNIYGALKVIKPVREPGMRKTMQLCQCSCGEQKIFNGSELRAGKRTSCGKHCNNYIDETGNKYGFLTVLEQDPTPAKDFPDKCIYQKCKCDLCGNIKSISGRRLRNGDAKSCGCLKSTGEASILKFLVENNYSFKQEYSFDNLLSNKNNPLRFDFAIFENNQLKYLIEFQGRQHFLEIDYFQKNDPLEVRHEYDKRKEEYCKQYNISLLKIIPKDINHPQRSDYSLIGNIIKNFEQEIKGEDNGKILNQYM